MEAAIELTREVGSDIGHTIASLGGICYERYYQYVNDEVFEHVLVPAYLRFCCFIVIFCFVTVSVNFVT